MTLEQIAIIITLAFDSESITDTNNRALESLAHTLEKTARARNVQVKRISTRNGKIELELTGYYRQLISAERWISQAFTRNNWRVWTDEYYYMTLAIM